MRLLLAALALSSALTPAVAANVGGPEAFDFVAFGDMPYKLPDDYPRVEALIGRINSLKPAFSIFVGDIKAGSTPCSDENFAKVKAEFDMVEGPLVYSIGDNEWTDCHREKAGKFNPMERLNKVRDMFFATPGKSLGKAPMEIERQSEVEPDTKAYDGRTFVENSRWMKNGVMFAVPHVPGSNNNFEPRNMDTVAEYFARNKANVAWINSAFAKAKAENAKAMVIALQADLWVVRQDEPALPVASGFIDTVQAIEKGAKALGKPVLVVHGDTHYFMVTPFYGTDMKPVKNVTRLQVQGDSLIGAVRVIVDPANEAMPFAFQAMDEVK